MTTASDFPFPMRIGGDVEDPEQQGADLIDGEGDAPGEQPSAEERLEEMQRRLDAEVAQARQREQTYLNTITKMTSGGEAAPQEDDDLNLDDLPDPVENVNEFRRQLSARIKDHTGKAMARASSETNAAQTQQQTLNNVWSRFQNKYGDLASREALLRGSVMAESDAIRATGGDVLTLMQSAPDDFIERVATRMRNELGEAGEEAGVQGKPSGRTRGASGGSRAPGKGGGKATKPPSFMDTLKKQQTEQGLI